MRHLYTGTTEYLDVAVTATVTLSAQTVQFSFDRSSWITASWIGTAGYQRQARATINSGNMPAVGTYTLFVKVTDSPETPIVSAGRVAVL